METKDTQIEGLEEIAIRALQSITFEVPKRLPPGWLKFAQSLLADPAIPAHIPAYKALQEEVERLSGLSKEYFDKLNGWQEAYIKAERTLLLAGFTDQGGELWKPPLGPSPSPLLGRIATLEAQLAGGEAVGRIVFTDSVSEPYAVDWASGMPPEGTMLYTAPAIKQQVAEDVADKSAAKHFNCDDSQLHVCHECDGYGVHP